MEGEERREIEMGKESERRGMRENRKQSLN